jgi:Icc-related predicted phosphoesterase
VEAQHSNLTWLNNRVVVIDGVRFLGTTLWFPQTPVGDLQTNYWSDFKAIPNFKNWVYEENAKARAFLKRECMAGDVVITHYLPSYMSVHPAFAGAATNSFFVSDEEALIIERKPGLWLHGHTHSSMRYTLNQTEVVCNPFGYAGHELNPRFEEKLILEVRKEKGPEL